MAQIIDSALNGADIDSTEAQKTTFRTWWSAEVEIEASAKKDEPSIVGRIFLYPDEEYVYTPSDVINNIDNVKVVEKRHQRAYRSNPLLQITSTPITAHDVSTEVYSRYRPLAFIPALSSKRLDIANVVDMFYVMKICAMCTEALIYGREKKIKKMCIYISDYAEGHNINLVGTVVRAR